MRQFYRTFPIANTVYSQLSWSHYKLLIRLENEDKREFYIAETTKNNWTVRQLERQINSQLYERLLLSNDKASVLAVARGEQPPSEPREIIKDPMVLEFLGLKREAAYYEKDLEAALITHLQDFLLELGNGFSLVARQKRLHIEGDEFFVDLVLYMRSKPRSSPIRTWGSCRCTLITLIALRSKTLRTLPSWYCSARTRMTQW